MQALHPGAGRLLSVVVLLLAVAIGALVSRSFALPDRPQPDRHASASVTPAPTHTSSPTASPPDPRPKVTTTTGPVVHDPARIRIPTIGVDAPITSLGLTDEGALATPDDGSTAGWWRGGAPPGGIGPAVIAGHVDWTNGPAVFYRLHELRAGDRVIIEGEDGTTVRFVVGAVDQFRKRAFPTGRVYRSTPQPTLRLITCGGPFDNAWGHYLDNVVVFATAVS